MLSLSLPPPHLAPGTVSCDPEQLAAWLQQLPYAHTFECAQRLRDALAQLNCLRLPAGSRLNLLQRYLQAVDRLLPVLEAEARPGELSHYSRARQAALLAQHLSILIHNGFKQVLLARSEEHGLFALERHKQEALHLSLLSARQTALLYARSYTPCPPGFWHDCHQLFLYALAHGWEDKAPRQKEDPPAALYRQLLLVGMTSCNRMEPGLIDYTLLLIRKYASHLHLVQTDRLQARQGAFLYQPQQDHPPRFYSELPALPAGQNWWIVDTQALQHALMEKLLSLQRLAQNRSDDQGLAEEIRRLLRLMQDWQSVPARRHVRHHNHQAVELVSLLSSCWFLANHARWDYPLPPEHAPPARPLPPAPASLHMYNLSASGMLLRGESLQHPLRTGELVMLRLPGKPWHLTVVRWVNLRGEGMEAECGLEQLGAQAEAVMVMPVITHPHDQYQMALLLPAQPRSARPAMLVLPGRAYQKLREFRLLTRQGEQLIRLTALDGQTAYYQFVEYQPADAF